VTYDVVRSLDDRWVELNFGKNCRARYVVGSTVQLVASRFQFISGVELIDIVTELHVIDICLLQVFMSYFGIC
jgi:hypothetical protein